MRCGVSVKTTSTTVPSATLVALRRQRRVDDRPPVGEGHIDRAVLFADRHRVTVRLDAGDGVVRWHIGPAGERHRRDVRWSSAEALRRRRQRQSRRRLRQLVVVGRAPTRRRPSPAAGAPTSGRARPACPRCTRTSRRRRRARAGRPCTGRTRRRRGSRGATSRAGSRSPAASRAPLAAGWRSAPTTRRRPSPRGAAAAVPHAVVEVQLAEPGDGVEVGVHAGEAEVDAGRGCAQRRSPMPIGSSTRGRR